MVDVYKGWPGKGDMTKDLKSGNESFKYVEENARPR